MFLGGHKKILSGFSNMRAGMCVKETGEWDV